MSEEVPRRITKQVLIVRKDLNMRKGKIASQSAHASLKVFLDMMVEEPCGPSDCIRVLTYEKGSAFQDWLNGAFTKITVSVDSEAALLDLAERAKTAGVPSALIQDSGRTEFHGVPTYTVLAIGPAWSDQIDPLTGGLPLL